MYPCSGVRRRRSHRGQQFLTSSPLKPLGQSKLFMWSHWEGGTKFCINAPGHMTKMTAMLKNAQKTLKNLLLQNHWANCLETWYVALGSVVLLSLYKSWSLVVLDLFYGKVNFSFPMHLNGNSAEFFFIFLLLLYSKVWKWSQVHHLWMLEVNDIYWPWQRSFELKTFDKSLETIFQKQQGQMKMYFIWSHYGIKKKKER